MICYIDENSVNYKHILVSRPRNTSSFLVNCGKSWRWLFEMLLLHIMYPLTQVASDTIKRLNFLNAFRAASRRLHITWAHIENPFQMKEQIHDTLYRASWDIMNFEYCSIIVNQRVISQHTWELVWVTFTCGAFSLILQGLF